MRLEEWGVPDYYELINYNQSFLEENKSDVEKVIN